MKDEMQRVEGGRVHVTALGSVCDSVRRLSKELDMVRSELQALSVKVARLTQTREEQAANDKEGNDEA